MLEHLDIDNLVRSILDDLAVAPPGSVAPVPLPVPVESEPKIPNEIYLSGRVVSLSDIKSLGGTKRICIAPRSVLTPSAKDEIRKQKIEIVVRLPQSRPSEKSPLWLATQRPAEYPRNIVARWATATTPVRNVFDSSTSLVEKTRRLLEDGRTLGVALSHQAALVVCEANRFRTIRAILGLDPEQVVQDAESVQANLLVLHPDRVGNKLAEIIEGYANR